MPTTTYKGMSVPTTGTENNTWGDDLNANTFAVADRNLGGITTKTLSNVNVTLSSTESQSAILRLTGTLTGAVQITTACQGFTYVENLTSGLFAVTFTNGVGSPITLAQSARTVVITDTTNGPRAAAGTDPAVPSGSTMLFFDASAPSGWTKSTTHNNKAIRLVSGSGGASGGSVAFTTAFASQTPTGTVGDTTLSISQIPLHGHPFRTDATPNAAGDTSGGLLISSNAPANKSAYTGTPTSTNGQQIGGTGGSASHTHTFAGTAMDFAVQYVDAIIAIKD